MVIKHLKSRGLIPKTWKGWFFIAVAVGGAVALAGLIFVLALASSLPSVEQIDSHQISQSTRIYDRENKVVLYDISADKKRIVVPYEDVPQSLKDATLAIEDKDFYTSPAFSWKGILRAALANLQSGEIVQGGSTITQQLARNAFLTTEQTPTRKLKELFLAIQLSRRYSKDKILWLYLNEIPYGATIYGAGTASQAYFNKPIQDLTIAESAILASIPKAPPYYSPWGNHTKELFARQKLVLRQMFEQGRISKEEYDAALAEQITFEPQKNGIRAPHFVFAVQDYLIKRYGEDMVRKGGLSVVTTLDMRLQEHAEKVVLEGALRNEELYKGKNAALVAEDPKTGQILALVGSRDYFDRENEGNFNVATQGLRQPGSALKPFAYMAAFEKGYVPETILFDVPTEFAPNNPKCPPVPNYTAVSDPSCFHPQDFDPFKGPMKLKDALPLSANIPAVKTLYLAGIPKMLETLENFGITTLTDPRRYGLSLVLGGGEVKLLELVKAYATLSQEGVKREQTFILEVRDQTGRVLESYQNKDERVIDPQYPRMINSILSDVNARAPLFQASLNLTVFPDHEVALKTGTTNDYRDAWAMGYTPSLVVGVWAGNNDNAPMQRKGGSILAAIPIWNAFLVEAIKNVPTETFTRAEYTLPSKPMLAGNYVVDNQIHNILYYVNKNDPLGDFPSDPMSDPQSANWEVGVLNWVKDNFLSIPFSPGGIGAPGSIQIQIKEPTPGTFISDNFYISAQIFSPSSPITQIRTFWNGQMVNESLGEFTDGYTYSFFFSPPNATQQNLIEIQAVNKNGESVGISSIVYKN